MKESYLMIQGLLVLITSLLCPKSQADSTSAPEAAEDRPWANLSRQMAASEDPSFHRNALSEALPGFLEQLEQDGKNPLLSALWGESRNIDESNLSRGTLTVPKSILQYFASILNVPFHSSFSRGHAGLTHTYGYLFSTLSTPYGFKRARYVRHEIESGFGIPEGLISGTPAQGSLLLNLTVLGAKIAFKDHPEEELQLKNLLEIERARLPEVLARLLPPKSERLTESFEAKGPKGAIQVELQTDLAPFTAPNPHGKNSALLVYSLRIGNEPLKLITVFPVEKGFIDALFKPELMGESVSLKLKYNALLPEPLVLPEPLTGKRVHHHAVP